AARSSAGMPRHSASRSATCLEGRRPPDSIFTTVSSEQPTRLARSCCVRSRVLRRCLSHRPNDVPVVATLQLYALFSGVGLALGLFTLLAEGAMLDCTMFCTSNCTGGCTSRTLTLGRGL